MSLQERKKYIFVYEQTYRDEKKTTIVLDGSFNGSCSIRVRSFTPQLMPGDVDQLHDFLQTHRMSMETVCLYTGFFQPLISLPAFSTTIVELQLGMDKNSPLFPQFSKTTFPHCPALRTFSGGLNTILIKDYLYILATHPRLTKMAISISDTEPAEWPLFFESTELRSHSSLVDLSLRCASFLRWDRGQLLNLWESLTDLFSSSSSCLDQLEQLSINYLPQLATSTARFYDALRFRQNLVVLQISYNDFFDDREYKSAHQLKNWIPAIGHTLRWLPRLTTLSLMVGIFDEETMETVATNLPHAKELEVLSLYDEQPNGRHYHDPTQKTRLSFRSWIPLFSKLPKLKELVISAKNNTSYTVDHRSIGAWFETIVNQTNIVDLSLYLPKTHNRTSAVGNNDFGPMKFTTKRSSLTSLRIDEVLFRHVLGQLDRVASRALSNVHTLTLSGDGDPRDAAAGTGTGPYLNLLILFPNITTIYHPHPGLQEYSEDHLTANNKRLTTAARYWSTAAVLIRFYRANRDNPVRSSILQMPFLYDNSGALFVDEKDTTALSYGNQQKRWNKFLTTKYFIVESALRQQQQQSDDGKKKRKWKPYLDSPSFTTIPSTSSNTVAVPTHTHPIPLWTNCLEIPPIQMEY